MDYSNSCRLCLSETGRQLPIFRSADQDDGLEPLNARILAHLSIEVSQFDDLPKQICHRCECQVNVWHYFKAECGVSQQKLRRWHELSNSFSHTNYPLEESEQTIKAEPEDIDLHAEHHINDTEELGSIYINGYDAQVEEGVANHGTCLEMEEESNQSDNNANPSDGFNLVISGTTSILAEENASSQASDVNRDQEDRTKLSVEGSLVPETPNGAEHSDDSILDTQLPRHSIIEVNLENSNDSGSDVHNVGAVDPLEDIRIKSFSFCEEPFKIKEEQEEGEAEKGHGFQTCPNDLLSSPCKDEDNVTPPQLPSLQLSTTLAHPQSTKKRNENFLHTSTNLGGKIKGSNVSKQGANSVYNYTNIDLPKINNEVFDENSKYCKICKKSYQNSNLWRHMKLRHANVNPFRCGGCAKIFPGRRELVTHRVRTVSKYCRAGEVPDVDMSSIVCHGKVRKGKMGKYECVKCKKKFRQLNVAKAHVQIHAGELPFFCYKCNDKAFRFRKSAYKHVAVCKGKNYVSSCLSKVNTDVLPGSIVVSKVLKRSAIQPHRSKDKILKCIKCSKVFNNRIGYANHTRFDCLRRCFSCSKHVPSKTFYKHFRKCLKSPADQISEYPPSSSAISESESAAAYTLESRVSSKDLEKEEENKKKDVMDVEENKVRKNAKITKVVDVSLKDLLMMHRDMNGKRTLSCQLCQKTLGSRKSMHSHLLKHSSHAFKCEQCKLYMSLRSSYEAHMSKFHEGYPDVSRNEDPNKADLPPNQSSESSGLEKAKLAGKFSGFQMSKLKCELCQKLFSSASSLKFHKLIHKRMKCEKCEVSFPATMEKSHVCSPKIKVEFSAPDQEHVAQQRKSEALAVLDTCVLCTKTFHTRKMLYQHKKMHIKMKIYKCQICCHSYSDAAALQQHKEEVHDEEPPTNVQAANGLSTTTESAHIQPVEGNKKGGTEVKLWNCDVCHKQYSRRDTWKKHMTLHRSSKSPTAIQKPQNPGVLHCSLCDKAFESHASFICHKGWHSRQNCNFEPTKDLVKSEPLFSPEDISKSGLVPDNTRASLPPESFQCDICFKSFAALRNLRIHVACVHTKEKMSILKHKKEEPITQPDTMQPSEPHKCEICFKIFPELSLFSTHVKSHSSEKDSSDISNLKAGASKDLVKPEPLQCKLCNKQYRTKKFLKYHMMGHSGENPFKCRSCSNQYSNPKALARHEKERHTPVLRPFCCKKCKSSFILKEDLLAHHEKCAH